MKTIEEQIMEARDDLTFAQATIADATEGVIGLSRDGSMAAYSRIVDRAAARLATLEAVRDGRMAAVFATVSVSPTREWVAYGSFDEEPDSDFVLENACHANGDVRTVLRGYAHVPSTQVHEVEAEVES